MTLAPGEVQVWVARLDSQQHLTPTLEHSLSLQEHAAATQFYFAADRLRYSFAHSILRDILSRYVDCTAKDLCFDRNPYGKPFLIQRGSAAPPAFNMSHSGSVVLVAVSLECQIGVDVEQLRSFNNLDDIARSHFTTRECAFIMGHAPQSRCHAFLKCWTRKEAYIKATGKGMSMPLDTFDSSVALERAGWISVQTSPPATPSNVWLADLNVPSGYLGSIAVDQRPGRLTYCEWRAARLDSTT